MTDFNSRSRIDQIPEVCKTMTTKTYGFMNARTMTDVLSRGGSVIEEAKFFRMIGKFFGWAFNKFLGFLKFKIPGIQKKVFFGF